MTCSNMFSKYAHSPKNIIAKMIQNGNVLEDVMTYLHQNDYKIIYICVYSSPKNIEKELTLWLFNIAMENHHF